jgi:hypothetical protein
MAYPSDVPPFQLQDLISGISDGQHGSYAMSAVFILQQALNPLMPLPAFKFVVPKL